MSEPSWRTVVAALLNARLTSRKFCKSTAVSTNVAMFKSNSGASSWGKDAEFCIVVTGSRCPGLWWPSGIAHKAVADFGFECCRDNKCRPESCCSCVGRLIWGDVVDKAGPDYLYVLSTASVHDAYSIDCHKKWREQGPHPSSVDQLLPCRHWQTLQPYKQLTN